MAGRVTDYTVGRWAVFEHARQWHAAPIAKNYAASVVVAWSLAPPSITARKRKDRVAATLPGMTEAKALATSMNEIEREFEAKRAQLFDWATDMRRLAVDAAVRRSGEWGNE